MSQATAEVKNSGTITITWDLSNGTSQSYIYTLSNPAIPVLQTWSGLSGTGTLVSTTGASSTSVSGSGSMAGLTVTSVSQVNGQLVLVGTKNTGGSATFQESIDGGSVNTLWDNMPDGTFNFSSWFNVNLANGPHTVTLSFQGSSQTLTINFTVGSSTSSSTTSTSSTSSTSSSTAASSGSGSMSGLTVSSVSQVNGQLVLVGTKSTGGNATLQESVDGGASNILWDNMPDGPFNFSSWFNVNLANGSHTIVLSFQGSSQTLTINFTVGSTASTTPVASTSAAAISPVSNLFTTVLGYQAGADGYAGENDNLAYWTGQLAGGTSLSAIRTSLANGSEAQTVLGNAYQSVFGQTMGSATLKAAQSYLANGGSLQQLEALWSSAQPQLTAQVNNLYGAAMSATPLDAAVALVTSGSSISSAEASWAGQAETDVSTLFENVLGYTPGSDGYAGESDNLSGWTGQAEAGVSLGEIQSLFAYSAEAQSDLGKSYQSIFGQAIGTATMQAAEQQMLNGATLQQIESLWSSVQPFVASSYTSFFDQTPSASNLDLGVSQATRQLEDDDVPITLTWDTPSGVSRTYTYDLSGAQSWSLIIKNWSGIDGAGALVNQTQNNRDGSSSFTRYEASTAGTWSSITQVWTGANATGSMESQTTDNYDGTSAVQETNWQGSQTWSSNTVLYSTTGTIVSQTIKNNDGSTDLWTYDANGNAVADQKTVANGTYTVTDVAPATPGVAWTKSSYTAAGVITDEIIENSDGSWTEDKYWGAALEETDAHALDGTEIDTVNNESGTGGWSYYTLDKGANGINVKQTIENQDGSFSVYKFDAYGETYDVQTTSNTGSWTETFFTNGQAAADGGWDWQQNSYTKTGVLVSQVKHFLTAATSSAAASTTVAWEEYIYSPSLLGGTNPYEVDYHYADGSEMQKIYNGTQWTQYNNNSSGQAVSAQILQPNGTWSNVVYGANGAATEEFFTSGASGSVETSFASFDGQGDTTVTN